MISLASCHAAASIRSSLGHDVVAAGQGSGASFGNVHITSDGGMADTGCAGAARIRKDDHVVLCWARACGVCPACLDGRSVLCDRLDKVTFRNKLPSGATHLRARDRTVAPFLGTACFADCVIVPEAGAI